MRKLSGPVLLGTFLALCIQMGIPRAFATAPGLTISATNVVMPLHTQQYGSSTFILVSGNSYTGVPQVTCTVVNPPAGAKLPACYQHGIIPEMFPDETFTGTVLFVAPGQTPPPEPASLLNRSGRAATGMALAAMLFIGFGVRRLAARWLTLVVLAIIAFGGLAAISACGGNGNSMTPGVYSYSVTATDSTTGNTASTTISVTIP